MKQKEKWDKSLVHFLPTLESAKATIYLEDCFTRPSSFQSQQVEIGRVWLSDQLSEWAVLGDFWGAVSISLLKETVTVLSPQEGILKASGLNCTKLKLLSIGSLCRDQGCCLGS